MNYENYEEKRGIFATMENSYNLKTISATFKLLIQTIRLRSKNRTTPRQSGYAEDL